MSSWGSLVNRAVEEGIVTADKNGTNDNPAETPSEMQQNGEEKEAGLTGLKKEKVRGKMIMSEIEKFRLAQEERQKEQELKRRQAIQVKKFCKVSWVHDSKCE